MSYAGYPPRPPRPPEHPSGASAPTRIPPTQPPMRPPTERQSLGWMRGSTLIRVLLSESPGRTPPAVLDENAVQSANTTSWRREQ